MLELKTHQQKAMIQVVMQSGKRDFSSEVEGFLHEASRSIRADDPMADPCWWFERNDDEEYPFKPLSRGVCYLPTGRSSTHPIAQHIYAGLRRDIGYEKVSWFIQSPPAPMLKANLDQWEACRKWVVSFGERLFGLPRLIGDANEVVSWSKKYGCFMISVWPDVALREASVIAAALRMQGFPVELTRWAEGGMTYVMTPPQYVEPVQKAIRDLDHDRIEVCEADASDWVLDAMKGELV